MNLLYEQLQTSLEACLYMYICMLNTYEENVHKLHINSPYYCYESFHRDSVFVHHVLHAVLVVYVLTYLHERGTSFEFWEEVKYKYQTCSGSEVTSNDQDIKSLRSSPSESQSNRSHCKTKLVPRVHLII